MSNLDVLSELPADTLEGFVPDPDLDALYHQAVVVAKEYGWLVPERAKFERRYREEIEASRRTENQIERQID